MLVGSTDSQRKEIESLRKKNLEFSSSLVTHQQRIEQLSHEYAAAREEAKKLDLLCSNFRTEKEILKASETRLTSENNQLKKEKAQQQALFDNLQTLLQTKEKGESDHKHRLIAELESAQRDWHDM
jgi:hypothetical protein